MNRSSSAKSTISSSRSSTVAPLEPVDRSAQVHVLAPREVGVEAGAELEQRADRPSDLDAPGRRAEDAGDQPEERRLARAVSADEADRPAGLDVQRDVSQRPDVRRLQVPPSDDRLFQGHVPLRIDAEAPPDVLDQDLAYLHGFEGTPTACRESSARPRMKAGSSFSDSIRSRSRPSSAARSRASTSMSQRISRWSETKPIGQTRTRVDAGGGERVELLEQVRAEPGLSGRARALVGERPVARARPARQRDAPSRAVDPGTGSPDSRIRAGRLWAVKTTWPASPRTRSARTSRYGSCMCQLSTKRSSARSGERVDEPLAIALDGEARVVRRQDDADDRLGAAGERPLDGLGDARPPVLHPDEDGRAQLALERGPLGLGRVVERRAPADPPVALGQLLDRAWRDRLALAHVGEIGGHVLGARRAPVGHEDDRELHAATCAVCSCTSSTRRPRSAGSVSGSTPWPRLKMWPGRPPARLEDRRAPPRASARTARAGAPGRGCPARPGRSRPAASPRRAATRQSSPITSPPDRGHRLEQVRRPGPEMDRRDVDRGEDPRRVGRDELLVVGPRERADPGVEELDDVGAGRDLRRAGRRSRSRSASPSARARPRASRTCTASSARSRGSASPRRGSRRR